jgi:hypothetical protein
VSSGPEAIIQSALALLRIVQPKAEFEAGRYSLIAICGSFAALAALGAIGATVAAFWIGNLQSLGPEGAALMAAATLSILSLTLIGIGAAMILNARRTRTPPAPDPAVFAALITDLIKANSSTLLIGAILAGFIVDGQSRKR